MCTPSLSSPRSESIHCYAMSVYLSFQLTLSEVSRTAKKELNQISLDFELPMFICSGMNIRFLRVFEQGRASYTPFRWVRYITHRYVCVFVYVSQGM